MVLALPLVLIAISCGGGGGGGGGGIFAGAATGSVWLDVMKPIPDTPDTRSFLVMNDYAALRAVLNVQPPAQDAGEAEMKAYQEKLGLVSRSPSVTTGIMPAEMTGLGAYFDPAEWSSELGFNLALVDQDALAGQPPHTYSVLKGRFDAKRIDTATDKDTSAFRAKLTKTTYGGSSLYVWGEDLQQDLRNRSAVRPLGRGGRLAVSGNYLYWTYWTDGAREMIDTGGGKKASLAQAEDFKLLAGGLSRYGLYAVIVTDQGITIDPASILLPNASPATVRAALDAQQKEALRPYQALAVGVGQDAQGPFNVLVVLHPDAKTATENVARLRAKVETGKSLVSGKAWSEQIEKSEISSDGRLLLAKLRTQNRTLLADVLLRRDSLLVHE